MHDDVIPLDHLHPDLASVVGGKAANLGALTRIDGVAVPWGFVVPATAYAATIEANPRLSGLLDRLSTTQSSDEGKSAICAAIRSLLHDTGLPTELEDAIAGAVGARPGAAWAVRSSATAEDGPATSFAGQHDSHLSVPGSAVADRVRRCWASLFTDRAVAYRDHHRLDHRDVRMAVVVQELVDAQASGVLFTAHPVTSDRTVVAVEATVGLGEALVAGRVPTDTYEIRNRQVTVTRVATKAHAMRLDPDGGTRTDPVDPASQNQPALSTAQARTLADLGRRIEAHFCAPQDIEWCIDDNGPWVVQSRPITALFPIPEADDDTYRVYVSVGHAQMMTDPMTPLGLSVWQLTSPAPMHHAAGRLFVDVTQQLASPSRAAILGVFGRGDPLVRDALETILDRDVVQPTDDAPTGPPPGAQPAPDIDADESIVHELIAANQASVAELRRDIRHVSGPDLCSFIRNDLRTLRRQLFEPRSHAVVMAGMQAAWWLNDNLSQWLSETNAADALSQAAPHNITSQVGLDLLDVADAIRPHPAAVALLRTVGPDDADHLERLRDVDGGTQACAAIEAYLGGYGMRCVGEIDIGRPRWAEQPQALAPLLVANIDYHEPGERRRRLETGRSLAGRRTAEVLEQVRSLPDGEAKARETRAMIDRLRTFIGYREYPKYGMIARYFEYKKALLAEADRLVDTGVIDRRDDIFFLRFDELEGAIRNHDVDTDLIGRRRGDLASFHTLSPPRVLTSDGEHLNGSYQRNDLPTGAIGGLAVSGGTVEGRARIVHTMADAHLEHGDILVTTHTDPSWSPLFVTAAGLVTEVGGLMTHGSVVAREYGLPAVVGVAHATTRMTDGQRIIVNGTAGYVQLL